MAVWRRTVTAKVPGIGVLALVMYLTCRIDWYAYVPISTEPAQPPPAIMERS